MVELQIISRILENRDYGIIERNQLDVDYFPEYPDEIKFIVEHYKKWGNVPDKATFLSNFTEFEIVDVTETEDYLIDTLREEYLYRQSVPVIQKAAELLKTNANDAASYMLNAVRSLQPNYHIGAVDIIADAQKRYDEYITKKDNQDKWFFTTGFPELDDITHGIQRGEEYFVIVARTNQGKSWVLEKICSHIWEIGFNVGYISPEMSGSSIGYRFDTLFRNFSNRELMWGNNSNEGEYSKYIQQLKSHKNKFLVATPSDFDRKITVSKLRGFIKQYSLDVIAVDGITYLSDERGKPYDNKTTSLTNISEDLMLMSVELGVPVLVVVQANRSAAGTEEEAPELESIRDSDGIAYNASKVISLRQNADGVLTIQVKKQRNGRVGDKLRYQWDTDRGEFHYIAGGNTKRRTQRDDVF